MIVNAQASKNVHYVLRAKQVSLEIDGDHFAARCCGCEYTRPNLSSECKKAGKCLLS
jgi:hypothetical protein